MAECGWGGRAEAVVNDLADLAHTIQPGLLSGSDAGRLAQTFTRAERLCGVVRMMCAKRAAECATWSQEGFRSEHEWFARMIGAGLGAARDQLELAGQLEDQPEVAEAWKQGELSPAQTKEISKAAQADPSSAGKLIKKAANSSHKGLTDECRKTIANARSAEDEAAQHRRIHRARYCRLWVDDEGAGRIEAKLTPEALATVRACLDPFAQREFDLARLQGRRERTDAYAADALVAMAQAAAAPHARGRGRAPAPGSPVGPPRPDPGCRASAGERAGGAAGDPDPDPGGTPPAAPPAPRRSASAPPASPDPRAPAGAPSVAPDGRDPTGDASAGPPAPGGDARAGPPAPGGDARAGPPTPGRVGPPTTVIAVVSHDALLRGHTEGGETCCIDGVGPVPVATVRAMTADAFLATVVSDGINIRAVAHTGRQVTAHQRTALAVRDPVCVVPGCHVRNGLEIDHVTPWAATKVTTLDRLARLCRYHHHQKTYEGWSLAGPPGQWTWTPPTDRGGQGETGPPGPGAATLFDP